MSDDVTALLTTLQGVLARHSASFDALEMGIGKLVERLERMEAAQTRTELAESRTRADIMQRIDRLADDYKSQREEMNVNYSSSLIARKSIDAMSDQIDSLLVMYRRLEAQMRELRDR